MENKEENEVSPENVCSGVESLLDETTEVTTATTPNEDTTDVLCKNQ